MSVENVRFTAIFWVRPDNFLSAAGFYLRSIASVA